MEKFTRATHRLEWRIYLQSFASVSQLSALQPMINSTFRSLKPNSAKRGV
jgi:hypothetical protein